MPFSSGVFTPYTPGNPVVTNTVISATVQNNTMNDIATGLSTALLKNGTQTVTANIPFAGFSLTNAGLRAIDGSSGVPSISFETDTDLGFYRFGANNVGVAGALTATTLTSWAGLDVTQGGTDSAAFTAAKTGLDRALIVPKGAYTIGSSVSFDAFPARIITDPHATFSGAGRILMNDLLPYHSDLYSFDIMAKVFDGSFPSYSDIFFFARYVRVDTARKAVALYGEGEANFSGSNAWGINTAGIAAVTGATAIGAEITALSNAAGTTTTGVLIGGKGTNQNTAALQISSGATANAFLYGININNDVSKSSITSTGTLLNADFLICAKGFNFDNASFSDYEWNSPSLFISSTLASQNARLNVYGSDAGLPGIVARGSGASPATVIGLQFCSVNASIGFFTGGKSTTRQVNIADTTSSVNYVELTGGVISASVKVRAAGSDTDIDLQFTPKGTGNVRFGTHTGLSGETVSGYITVKDAGGASRKLAVVS